MRKNDFTHITYDDWGQNVVVQEKLKLFLENKYVNQFIDEDEHISKLKDLTNRLISDSKSPDAYGGFWISRNLFNFKNCLLPKELLEIYSIEDIELVLSDINDGNVTHSEYPSFYDNAVDIILHLE